MYSFISSIKIFAKIILMMTSCALCKSFGGYYIFNYLVWHYFFFFRADARLSFLVLIKEADLFDFICSEKIPINIDFFCRSKKMAGQFRL